MTIDRTNATMVPARMMNVGDRVIAGGKWRSISTIDEAANEQVHFRTDLGTDDEAHFLTGRSTYRWVEMLPI